MPPKSREQVKRFLTEKNFKALRSLGQNFLVDEGALERIVRSSGIESADTVLEIGPGLGSLTEKLSESAKQVLAVEIDKGLVAELRSSVPDNVKIIHSDILKQDLDDLGLNKQKFTVVANLPFNIGTAVIRRFLESDLEPAKMVFILQKEVAERILANNSKESVISLSVKLFGEPTILFGIPRQAYFPEPRVDTAVLEIKLHKEKLLKKSLNKRFFEIVKAGFSAKRKYLVSNLAKSLDISSDDVKNTLRGCGKGLQVRAEELSLDDWIWLTENLNL